MLLAGGRGSRLGILTSKMAKPAVPFGGKYRIIDFPLSNCINSGVDTVGVLTQYMPLKLNTHIGIGIPWDLDKLTGGVSVLPPYEKIAGTEWYTGTANAIYQNMSYMENYHPDYVLILSGDHIYKMDYESMLDFHKEQANSLEKIVDAFVDRMGGALNSHVKALGESVDELSQAQKTMSVELQRLIKQIVKTSKDTSQINEHAGIILEQLSGYIPLLTQTSQDSAKVIENMVKWSEDIQKMTDTQHLAMEKMTVEQNDLLKVMAEHEGNLDQTCEEISANQQQLSESLVQFTKAAETLAEREQDPMQFEDIKDMLSGYMTTMQKLQQESAQNIKNIQSAGIREMLTYVSAQTEANAKESQAVQQKLTEELQKLAKTQEDIVFLNAKIANTLSSLTGTGKIQLPSKGLQQDEEKWSKVLNEKMDAWIREQKAFQERLLQLEEERSQPFWSRWGRK